MNTAIGKLVDDWVAYSAVAEFLVIGIKVNVFYLITISFEFFIANFVRSEVLWLRDPTLSGVIASY